MSSSNTSANLSHLEAICPKYSDTELSWIHASDFWLDGVAKTSLAIWGLLTNTFACFILSRPSMKNSFNMSLSALAGIDSIYLIFEVFKTIFIRYVILIHNAHKWLVITSLIVIGFMNTEENVRNSNSCRFDFIVGHYLKLIYPNFLYPMVGITLTMSIFMTVVITYERYCAVYYHVDYRNVSSID